MENSFIRFGYRYEEKNGIGYYSVPSFDDEKVLNCFSTRKGGVSKPPYDELNLSLTRPYSYSDEALANYDLLAKALNISLSQMVVVNYSHGDGIQIVSEENGGNGILFPNRLPPCDALITNKKNVALATIHADCSSYLIFDAKNQVIAACHAGWKGTLLRIGAKTIKRMSEEFGTLPSDCIVGIGPNISLKRFEVDQPVADMFKEEYPNIYDAIMYRPVDNKYLIDLTKCAIAQFTDIGVGQKKITVSGLCTYEDKDHFYSYRRDGQQSGAMVSIILMRQ